MVCFYIFFFFQAEDGIRDGTVTGVQTCALPILAAGTPHPDAAKLAATAGKASRFNTYASGPMLFGMIVPNNYSGWNHSGIIIALVLGLGFRSEERRVGKECRCRWPQDRLQKALR